MANNSDPNATRLQPRDKILAIGLVNLFLLLWYVVANSAGFASSPDDDHRFLRPLWVNVGICAVAVLLPQLFRLFAIFGIPRTAPARFARNVLENDKSAISLVLRYAITVLSYVSVTFLVWATGGVEFSPFTQLPIALVLLAPVIMTKYTPPSNDVGRLVRIGQALWRNSALQNALWGLAYIAILYAYEPGWVDGPAIDAKLSPAGWVQPLTLGFVVGLSLWFNFVRSNPGFSGVIDDVLLEAAPAGSGNQAAGGPG